MSTDPNQLVFENPKIVQYYAGTSEPTAAEAVILRDYRGDLVNKRVLDLGVGAGRTVPWLAPLAASYVGLDYSCRMIERCAARYPQYRIEFGDARDLSRFPAAAFDFVLFSFNGIDSVGHADRLTILAEAARVLEIGGVFVFSTHSLQTRLQQSVPMSMVRIGVPRTPLQAVKWVARIGLRLGNYLRYNYLQVRRTDYAILLDPGHDFSTPIYNVSLAEQKRQLREAGFHDPRLLAEQREDYFDKERPYAFYYIARKLSSRQLPTLLGLDRPKTDPDRMEHPGG